MPSMHVMATIANRNRTSVLPKMLKISGSLSPSRSPASSAARKQPVPVAVSQLKSNRAASGVGLATTGVVRETFPCRYGQSQPGGPGRALPSAMITLKDGVVAWLRALLIDGSPQHRTKNDKIANGIHALTICREVK